MAGDWLKVEHETPDKPEVFAIAAKCGMADPDLAVGKLVRVWRWFDQQTENGNAPSVTLAQLDRLAGCDGFGQAMVDVGWLLADDAGLRIPKFERFNGQTAKSRALTAKRQRRHRDKRNAEGNGERNAASVTQAPPRLEIRDQRLESGLNGAIECCFQEGGARDRVASATRKALRKVGGLKPADAEMVAAAFVLVEDGRLTRDAVEQAVEAIELNKPTNPGGYFRKCLRNKAGDVDALLASVTDEITRKGGLKAAFAANEEPE